MANRDIIVIGGSSGAIPPLKTLLGSLPADLPAAVFVVLHIPARGLGLLASVVAAASHLPLEEARDGMPIERSRIYFGAPDRHLLLDRDHIRLGRGPRENLSRPAIDALFRSAAVHHGPRTIGVVLSGLLNDGAAGLHAIQQCGGLALVQQPEDAAADEMPRNAIQATRTQQVMPASRMGEALSALVREPPGPAQAVPPSLRLEVQIAAGGRIDSESTRSLGGPAALSCPSCGGVLSRMDAEGPLRFRCQVGHGYTADSLAAEQESQVDEALRVALRIIEERAELVTRMAEDGRHSGRTSVAEMYEDRAREYRSYAENVRTALLRLYDVGPHED